MKKIICFSGSPRKGVTNKLLEYVIDGIEYAGGKAIVYDLNNPNIRGCQGCSYCNTHTECILKNDYLHPMYEDIKNCEGIFFTSPIYILDLIGQSKILLDRLYPMIENDLTPRFPNKKISLIYSQASSNKKQYQDVINRTNKHFMIFGWDILEYMVVTHTLSPEFTIDQKLISHAFKMGRDIVLK